MRQSSNFMMIGATLAAGLVLALPATRAGAFAGNTVGALDAGFVPDTGQINRGFDEKNPSISQARPIPTRAQVRAALAIPDSDQPVPGGSDANATTGAALPAASAPGPIGATGHTMTAKFSQRNDTLDRVPVMALPLALSDDNRTRIYRAAMADKTPAAEDAVLLAPSSELTGNQALNEIHPLPASVSGIPGVRKLGYIKTKNKVFLVEPDTRIVVDEIDL